VLRWISLQLGHGSLSVTERHYASYTLSDGYQNPWIVPAGCLAIRALRDARQARSKKTPSGSTKLKKYLEKLRNSDYPPIWYIGNPVPRNPVKTNEIVLVFCRAW
jgi:hypothetical protein